ncbi:hypothetical protein [Bradyrhizobium sp. CCGUVB23]|uniref:hypothetical protein n=1 Tax=Bradyrhizobium sp. CCGUVB23 TaxID=2949630 RepID=UPI0020B1C2E0|nr:hypothetical protein [Bradyrhizobium sp. CCGUVB23]MCP3460379.1 hypothetical protein [Bradyrhizobium sp. CCGUVB23]
MTEPVRNIAQSLVSASHLMSAIWQLLWAVGFAVLGLWLCFSFENWFAIGGGVLAGLHSLNLLVEASATYLSARPAERPDERERQLRSQSLYVPMDRDRARQEQNPR